MSKLSKEAEAKKDIRAEFLKKRYSISEDYKNTASWKAWNYLRALVAQNDPGIVALYHAIHDEIDISRFGEELKREGVVVALPRSVQRGMPLVFNEWNPGEALDHDVLNIPCASGSEVKPHMIVLPMLAFTKKCERLGYGGGFYDMTMPELPNNVIKVGVAFACQEIEELPTELHDMNMDYVVTEEGVISCPD